MKRIRIYEEQIKALVLNKLRAQGRICRSVNIASEFLLGRTGVRADLAIWTDKFIGIEIKSELDSLRRLNHQLEASKNNFEEVILVLADKHLRALEAFDTAGVSIWVLDADGVLHSHFTATANYKIDWRGLLNQRDLALLSLEADSLVFREQFSRFFRKRFGPYSDVFWSNVGRRKITTDDLKQLSRFREMREGVSKIRIAEEQQWEAWRQFSETRFELAS